MILSLGGIRMYFVRYFSRQFNGTFWNLEKFNERGQALSYAEIVKGSAFIKCDQDRHVPPRLVKIN
jgi:hypothetical protein